MTTARSALLLAAAMIGVAVLAVFDMVPEKIAQFAPLTLLAAFPKAWLGRSHACGRASRVEG